MNIGSKLFILAADTNACRIFIDKLQGTVNQGNIAYKCY